MHAYPSDAARGQFEAVRDIFENARAKAKPRDLELYGVFCGVLYVIRYGCQWRMMPSDLPHWNTACTYYQIWTDEKRDGPTCLSLALSRITELIRASEERKKKASYMIVDSKSVKNADTAHEKGYDGGKRISGVKIHAAVDTIGLAQSRCSRKTKTFSLMWRKSLSTEDTRAKNSQRKLWKYWVQPLRWQSAMSCMNLR
jgi:transposase